MHYLEVKGPSEDFVPFAAALRASLPEGWVDEPMDPVLEAAIGPGPAGMICVRTGQIGERSFRLSLVDHHLGFALVSILPVEDKHTRELEPEEAGLVAAHVFRYWIGPVLGTKEFPSLQVQIAG